MGKWARKRRTGGNASFGTVQAPTPADFTLTLASATSENVNRLVGFPLPADRWGILIVNPATGAITFQTSGLATPLVATGLTTGTTYRAYVAWFIGTARVSEYSFVGTFQAGT